LEIVIDASLLICRQTFYQSIPARAAVGEQLRQRDLCGLTAILQGAHLSSNGGGYEVANTGTLKITGEPQDVLPIEDFGLWQVSQLLSQGGKHCVTLEDSSKRAGAIARNIGAERSQGLRETRVGQLPVVPSATP
jgi:hypothetical protein